MPVRSRGQGHLQLHSKLEGSLGYMSSCLDRLTPPTSGLDTPRPPHLAPCFGSPRGPGPSPHPTLTQHLEPDVGAPASCGERGDLTLVEAFVLQTQVLDGQGRVPQVSVQLGSQEFHPLRLGEVGPLLGVEDSHGRVGPVWMPLHPGNLGDRDIPVGSQATVQAGRAAQEACRVEGHQHSYIPACGSRGVKESI